VRNHYKVLLKNRPAIERISASVYVESNTKGCCSHSFIVTGEGVVMVDTPVVPAAAAVWQEEIDRHGQLRYIINTEPHIDHFGGSAFFSGIVVAHEEARKRIASMSVEEMVQMLKAGSPESLPLPDAFRYRLPEITFSENLTLHLGRHTFEILKMPGHTAYQTVVYIPEEKVLLTGDLIVNRKMPSLHEALPFEWLDSLRKLQKFDIDFVVPGHGAVGNAHLISDMMEALEEALETVRNAINEGMSLGEAKENLTLFRDYGDFLPGAELKRWLNRVNVGRLYQLLKTPY
jgi:cyclase